MADQVRVETSHRIRRARPCVWQHPGSERGKGQRRAGYNVRTELISVCCEAKVWHCGDFYLISWSRANSLSYLCF